MSLQKLQGVDFNAMVARMQEQAKANGNDEEIEKPRKGKGLTFMAYKLCIARKHLELCVTKKITPAESNLLRFLEIGTIGAGNSRRQIASKATFYLEDVSKALGYKEPAKIWRLLKSLHEKDLIIREKTRSKGKEILGLNPAAFEQILTDRHHNAEKKRHLSLAVDNTQNRVDNSKGERTVRDQVANES